MDFEWVILCHTQNSPEVNEQIVFFDAVDLYFWFGNMENGSVDGENVGGLGGPTGSKFAVFV